MMMKQLIQKAKIRFFEPDEVSGPSVRRMAAPLQSDMSSWPLTLDQTSAEQQRIQSLENQIQQLRADVARWKNSSRCFAHEMRDLLTD
jgi:hypothetical protein